MKFIQWIKSLFNGSSYQDDVEYYVATKHPKSTAEVEYWVREYNMRKKGWAI